MTRIKMRKPTPVIRLTDGTNRYSYAEALRAAVQAVVETEGAGIERSLETFIANLRWQVQQRRENRETKV